MNQPPTQTGHGNSIGGGAAVNIPRINIQAFCETPQTAATVETAFADRRMARAHGSVHSGGIAAAVSMFQTQSTPNLLLVESMGARDAPISELAGLAEVCQPDTKVVVIGQVNDVLLYRELIRQGVSEYIVAPGNPLHLIEVIAGLYRSEGTAGRQDRGVPFGRRAARGRAPSPITVPGTFRVLPSLRRPSSTWTWRSGERQVCTSMPKRELDSSML